MQKAGNTPKERNGKLRKQSDRRNENVRRPECQYQYRAGKHHPTRSVTAPRHRYHGPVWNENTDGAESRKPPFVFTVGESVTV